jgi:uncharacterized surface protein with fasciclin (FAS1) repeats
MTTISRYRFITSRGTFALALLAFAAGSTGCDSDDSTGGDRKDIVATAQAAGTFTTLVAAVGAAELTSTLQSAGPFTVFAPTDAAFAKLPPGTVDTLLLPENKAMLQAVLKYHVVAGEVRSAQVVTLTSATTLQGATVAVTVAGSTVKVNDATVTAVDVGASNGVIHVIDTVLLPPSS